MLHARLGVGVGARGFGVAARVRVVVVVVVIVVVIVVLVHGGPADGRDVLLHVRGHHRLALPALLRHLRLRVRLRVHLHLLLHLGGFLLARGLCSGLAGASDAAEASGGVCGGGAGALAALAGVVLLERLHALEDVPQEVERVVVHDAGLEVVRGDGLGVALDGDVGGLLQDVLHHEFQGLGHEHGRDGGDLADVVIALHHLLDSGDGERRSASSTPHAYSRDFLIFWLEDGFWWARGGMFG